MIRLVDRTLRQGLAALETVVRVHAHVLFSRSRVVGALLLAAAATDPIALAHGLLAVAVAKAATWLLGLEDDVIREGPYGYNALLVGLGVAHSLTPGLASLALASAAAIATAMLTAALSSFLARAASLPVLSLPFVLISWLLIGVAPLAGAAPPGHPLPLFDPIAPEPLSGALRGLGSLFFVPEETAGALVLAALLVHSRIATLLAAGAILLATSVARSAGVAGPSLETGLMLNGALTAIAVGGVWFVPSASSFALAAAGAVLSATLVLGLSGPMDRMGLPLLILPFNLGMGLVLSATRQRAHDRRPKSVDFAPGSPEENLAYFQTKLARFDSPYAVSFRLPFRGTWTCTQGEDGAHTHQGAWRHGYDFEVRGEDGAMFQGEGASLEDHHCFRLPVLAAADGVVVKVENDVADNVVGGLDLKRNWGNIVLLYHGPGLYSLVAHLARGSARVKEGQQVRRGDVLGLCGSSGRSPRPHLHFQLQASPQLGAPTLPCRFGDSVVVSGPNGESFEQMATTLVPFEGQQLRNLVPDAELAACFALEPGSVLAVRTGDQVEHLEHEVDLLGNLVLRSREHGAKLFFGRSGEGFAAQDALGSHRSAVHALRATLARVPFDGGPGLSWSDYLPARWTGWPIARFLRDFIAPFAPSAGVQMVYRSRRDRGRLIIEGESRKLRRGLPAVRTSAILSPSQGLLELELKARGRVLRVERVLPEARVTCSSERPGPLPSPSARPHSPPGALPSGNPILSLPQPQGDMP